MSLAIPITAKSRKTPAKKRKDARRGLPLQKEILFTGKNHLRKFSVYSAQVYSVSGNDTRIFGSEWMVARTDPAAGEGNYRGEDKDGCCGDSSGEEETGGPSTSDRYGALPAGAGLKKSAPTKAKRKRTGVNPAPTKAKAHRPVPRCSRRRARQRLRACHYTNTVKIPLVCVPTGPPPSGNISQRIPARHKPPIRLYKGNTQLRPAS